MIGVAALQLGNAIRHLTFSVSLQFVGRSLAVVLLPFRCGPRHCGQYSFGFAPVRETARTNARTPTDPISFFDKASPPISGLKHPPDQAVLKPARMFPYCMIRTRAEEKLA